ncbi:MAG: chemotaxis protein CheW [Hyphomicrobium sp.]|jgi:purine-binding chemotaxis protein CheW
MNALAPIIDQKSGGARELIAFAVGKQEFCIDVMAVREIRGWTPSTVLPHSQPFVRGVINLRGAVLPILDLAVRLGFPPAEVMGRHVIIVVQVGGQVVGLLVDAVSDILTVNTAEILPAPDVASDMAKHFVCGLLAMEGRMLSILSVASVLPERAPGDPQ